MFITYLEIFLLSMVPILELRFAIPFGVANGVPVLVTLLISVLGNMVPVPFILLFLRYIFAFLKTHTKHLKKVVEWLETHAQKKGKRVYRSAVLGLFLLVAIPLPGTGAWTGALVASVFDIRMKIALPVIALGVLAAGLIMSIITYGASAIFF